MARFAPTISARLAVACRASIRTAPRQISARDSVVFAATDIATGFAFDQTVLRVGNDSEVAVFGTMGWAEMSALTSLPESRRGNSHGSAGLLPHIASFATRFGWIPIVPGYGIDPAPEQPPSQAVLAARIATDHARSKTPQSEQRLLGIGDTPNQKKYSAIRTSSARLGAADLWKTARTCRP